MSRLKLPLPPRLLARAVGAAVRDWYGRLIRLPERPRASHVRLDRLLPHRRNVTADEIRALCLAVPYGDDTVLCRVLGRFKLFADARDRTLSPYLILDGAWELFVTEAVVSRLRPGMTVFDAGANLGYFTLLMAALVGPAGRVHAAEPNPRLAMLLRQSVAANNFDGRVTVHQSPLGAAPGAEVILRVPDGRPMNGHVVSGSGPAAMPVQSVDEIIGDGPLDAVKIDVEGAEWDVWQGMEKVLARGQPMTVFLEFNRHRLADAGALLDSIARHGFSLAWIHPKHGILPIDRATILAREGVEDWMLLLSR
ncbi:FkbM family methyltransferase [Roseococcus sp. SYP-B2431]|uniref:FkbM family methyltransferase n=1 Tax=Roseococcus sp. SYP-B2431 TaxID=2496640 RepID=UPI0013F46720|nr:FkbM family methyltransferase [Roseococcus sp. SYP-B2431]